MTRQLHLNAFLKPPGEYLAAWRHPEAKADAGVRFDEVLSFARKAEQAAFDALFFADLVGVPLESQDVLSRVSVVNDSFEPTTLLAALAARTSRIGLIATASTSYNEPRHLARTFESLNVISRGRAGWNAVTSLNDGEALNFGLDAHLPHGDRYARAEEFFDTVDGLWEHKPVIVQAGASEAGKQFAARVADVIFSGQRDLAKATEFYAEMKQRAAGLGRDPDRLKILPALSVITAPAAGAAQAKLDALTSLMPPQVALAHLAYLLGGFDLTTYPLDGPLPRLPESNQSKSTQASVYHRARERGLTIRQLAREISDDSSTVVGTPGQVADHIEEWFHAPAADGFNLVFPYLPGTLDDFAELVVPALRARGLFRTQYTGTTLRAHLGLEGTP
ncbi:LLM class flavin-dependent oxidoreductase [Kibdelosporangium phytohabitans]|uniref:Nitrilotriacetate monooxygenase n=1 Tax=Kibdelosporangium phytohabitans TaxID=860235 RepID=A0A0N9I1L9_9PSEU|nr:LLM class flavin-dependent oxidoreductase [Kibdelosporangium phytohabitans]ALG09915.1 nitrilotriacetate monooxygenase [Kibdelosporangium phytohabitans]MBE1468679.1 alkanesulfonate monooxygenase SsuD/methylene tetrahydromethanopterin reductase-like flavin-dependent oxidoreductase (luciferase family) [Kibdelosporangium phytohabitans]